VENVSINEDQEPTFCLVSLGTVIKQAKERCFLEVAFRNADAKGKREVCP